MTVSQAPIPNEQRRARAPRAAWGQAPLSERPIRYVKGVGPRRALQLAQLGIETLEEACYFPPRRYEDRTRFVRIQELVPGELSTIRARVLARSLRRLRGSRTILEVALGDPSGVAYGVWFNQPYLAQQLKVGDELILCGRREPGTRAQLIHPELERVEGDDDTSLHMGRIVPVYPLVSGLSQRWLRQVIAGVLERDSGELEEFLPDAVRQSHGWPALPEAIRALHFPASWDALERAKQRLVFEELFLLQLALVQRRSRAAHQTKPQRYQLEGPLTHRLAQQLPFQLTASQRRVLEELLQDLAQPAPMYRLLQGDVGCGKTVVMLHAIAAAVQSGHQAALMAPTELLAEQHARVVAHYLNPLGVSVGLLTQGVPVGERQRVASAIASGEAPVVIGTHARIQRGVAFKDLALVIIDEQHKFGVAQRSHLARKALRPDVLVVTATPIPRTLALALYGDLAVSTITELPPGRSPIRTLSVSEAERSGLYAMVRQQLGQGRQGYVVYPLVEERQASDLKAATQMARQLQTSVFPEFRIGLLHGQMASRTKARIMRAFVAGELNLLVSTVIVEVGLDVPNATIMLIEHPERFGLAQLHQLRGRIGRGSHPATCAVVSDATEASVRQRLQAFVETTNGFRLAEFDLEQRGPGELLGRRQHGWMRFRIADLAHDRVSLEAARAEAEALIRQDPELRAPELAGLRERLARFRQRPA